MASKTVITLTDDIDGSDASQTITFALDGAQYEIDLTDVHADDLREVLAPFISVARRQGGRTAARSGPAPKPRTSSEVDPKAVRSWAEANGVSVNARGRLKSEVIEQYRAANN